MRSYQIGATPAAIVVADDTQGGGPRVTISNPTASIGGVYLGGDENQTADPTRRSGTSQSLTASTGFLLDAGKSVSLVLEGNEELYARSAITTVTITVHVLRSAARYT